uniref:Heliorhodopsin n=1 Tax=uncultured Actinomycetes bacterium TaxID=152507 RepID=A0A871XZ98_9ACTN|nr:Heliorhodopsin [uncultured Actinomycetes bacterium]QOV09083.1 Heliorhodopsin [uncultured Actinomycetes bacterium]
MASSTPLDIPSSRLAGLRRYNLFAGIFHAVQAIAIIALANDFALPVSVNYLLDAPVPGARFDSVQLFDFPIAIGVAIFSLLSALAHFWIVGPGFDRYSNDLRNKRNIARWIEYAISSTLMIVLISLINAVWDIVALIAIAGANVAMILFGWLQEKYEEPGKGSLLPFWFGCIAGAVPWIAMFLLLFSPGSEAEAPGFVYGIVISLFLFFNSFALVQWLQYKQIGKFADYLAGERTYITLSFIAKSLLAWQIFAGVLATSSL